MNYKVPVCHEETFNCPYCHAYAHHSWAALRSNIHGHYQDTSLYFSKCTHCCKLVLWDTTTKEMLKPANVTAPVPHVEMPEGIKVDFEEAREVCNKSPRSAAALLRLCLEKLCKHLGAKGKDIDKSIGFLVSQGLAHEVSEAMDAIRVLGNESVHAGDLTVEEIREDVTALFELTNYIIEEMIAAPKKRKAIFDKISENKKASIEERNKKAREKTA